MDISPLFNHHIIVSTLVVLAIGTVLLMILQRIFKLLMVFALILMAYTAYLNITNQEPPQSLASITHSFKSNFQLAASQIQDSTISNSL